tara:strand:+ start:1602 stop:2561 length:960 start_codon:yes stop_codon:yes gene_type:complete
MNYRKIHVFGGSGFIGTRLISLLNPYFDVQNMDLRNSKTFNKITVINDICSFDANQVDLNKSDCVILLAAEHRDDVFPFSKYYKTNVEGTKNVLIQMDKVGCKNLIFTSTVAVYGLNNLNPNEDFEPKPFNHYGKSKLKAENIIKNWFKIDPKNKYISIIRPTVIFGEENRGNVYNLIKQIVSKNFLMIGNGNNIKSMAYVGNVVEFILDRLKKQKIGCEIFNYVDKPDLTMNQILMEVEENINHKIPKIKIPYFLGLIVGYLFDLLSFIFKKQFIISSVRVKKFCANTGFDGSKINKIFKPPFSLKEGLKRTIKHDFN